MLYTQENERFVALVKYFLHTWWHNITSTLKVRTIYTFRPDQKMAQTRFSLVADTMRHRYPDTDYEDDRWMEGSPFPVPVFTYKSDAKYASRKLGAPFLRKWYPVYD